MVKMMAHASPESVHDAEPPEPGSSGPAELVDTVLGFLGVLRRRWLTVVVCMLLSVSAGVFAGMVLPPTYEARATLVLNLNGPQILDTVKGVSEDEQWGFAAYKQYYETQRTIIGSRAIASRVLDELGLAEDPVFLGIDHIDSSQERERRAATIDPVERLQEMIAVNEVRNSRVVRVSAQYPDASVARDMANEVVAAYLEHLREARSDTGEQAKENLEAERTTTLAQLRRAESALDAFKNENEIMSISLADRQNLITQNIITLTERNKAAMAARVELESLYEQVERLRDAGSIAAASLLAAQDQLALDSLLTERLAAARDVKDAEVKYLGRHPALQRAQQRLVLVDRRIAQEREQLLASLDARLNAARATERRLGIALEKERQQALKLGRLEPAYRAMEREVETAANAYAVVARRDTEVGMTNRVEIAPVRVLDLATAPAEPSFPNKPLLVAVGAVLGLVLGALAAIAVDLRDHRIRDVGDLERSLSGFGLPVLGQLPLLPIDPKLGAGNVRAQRKQRDLYAHLFPQSLMAERCRGLRTSLVFALAPEGPVTIMVTSPGSAEGKSSTAINLAASFCQADKRVVVVDADMRRPRLHQLFPPPVGDEAAGLAGVLARRIDLDAALRPADVVDGPANLSLLPCGELPENPAELLGQPACRQVLAELATRFDVVIIDSPPLLPVTDPLILARQVDAVVLVARCRATTAHDLERALGMLHRSDTNLLGVVLNEIDPRRTGDREANHYYYYHSRETAVEPA
ncbi:MAG: polysaccharide biosynthesis tyrosine autokinase [Myxococcales bacterium FL481]|nr:MAG: polysaccharide biosynthesis tyrosine autokinase [Myxococcales bacterium FL481]